MGVKAVWDKIYKTLATVRTGIILLITVVIVSALGTLVLQRPTSDVDVIRRTYSPTTLLWLDRLGLTDVYHSWWFVGLLALVSLSIIFVSIERWPNAWRFYARPYRRPEAHFRAVLPNREEFAVKDAKVGIDAATRAFAKVGLKAEKIVDNSEVSLYAEKHRFSVFAVYIVHFSLLLIFTGGIVDALYGYRGFVAIPVGDTVSTLEMHDAKGNDIQKPMPFALRCDGAGQENYPDGTPKKWWSNLVVLKDGQVVKQKQIIVNDPLIYHGIRVYQASYGQTGKLERAEFRAAPTSGTASPHLITLAMNKPLELDADTTVTLTRFEPDFYVQDNQVFTKSESPDNPAFELKVNTKSTGKDVTLWLFPRFSALSQGPASPYTFAYADMKMANFTGLEVSFQPGQWGVWAGVLLMAFGLTVAFFMAHLRFWAMVVDDPKKGLVLWVGGACNKNKERFETRFKELTSAIREELRASGNGDGAQTKKNGKTEE